MERLLAARGRHGWTSAVTKGAPCSGCSAVSSEHGDLFHTQALPLGLLPALDNLHREGKVSSGYSDALYRAALRCTLLPMLCLGRELCGKQLLKSKPRTLFCPEDSFFVKCCEAVFSCLHEWKHCVQHRQAVYCLTSPLKGFLLLASRLMW